MFCDRVHTVYSALYKSNKKTHIFTNKSFPVNGSHQWGNESMDIMWERIEIVLSTKHVPVNSLCAELF